MPFIVIEGLDGAGKSTQVNNIISYFKEHGFGHFYMHFPRFDTPVYGDLVSGFLRGEFGEANQVDPRLVALIYAGDRAYWASEIRNALDKGEVVILDRYVYSNIAYQCAKEEDQTKRKKLQDMILELEYDINKIPQPDLSLFLDVPFEFTKRKLEEVREGEDRDYLQGKKDIHEASLALQSRVREVYLSQSGRDDKFKVVRCDDGMGAMLPADKIFELIKQEIDKLL